MENFKDITTSVDSKPTISLETWIRFKVNELESMQEYSIATDAIRAWIDIYLKRHIVAKKEDIEPILESIDDTSDDGSDPTNICCEHFKTFIPLFSWFTINEDTLIMPNLDNIRVQYCPSCGKYIRDIQLSKRDSLQYFK